MADATTIPSRIYSSDQNPHSALESCHTQNAEHSTVPEVATSINKQSTVYGVRTRTLLLTFLSTVVVIVAVVGSGVGGFVAGKRAKVSDTCSQNPFDSSTTAPLQVAPKTTSTTHPIPSTSTSTRLPTTTLTATTTLATTAPLFPLPTNIILPLSCPAINDTYIPITQSTQIWTFHILCSLDFLGPVTVLAVTVYSLDDCLAACASYNRYGNRDKCLAVEFGANMPLLMEGHYGTCFLKNGTTGVVRGTEETGPQAVGVLVGGV